MSLSTQKGFLNPPTDWREQLLERLQPERRLRREYTDYLLFRHRNFDVKGLTTQRTYTLELERVFVDLTLELGTNPRSPDTTAVDGDGTNPSANPIPPMPQASAKKGYRLWTYLTAKKMQGRNLVIIGSPGSGKTTLLKHLTLMLAAQKTPAKGSRLDKLPILLFLRDHADAIRRQPKLSLAQVVQNQLAKWQLERPSGWFEAKLQKGECLIMLDGLDEVADPRTRKAVVRWVDVQMQTYVDNRFIVTSRPFGYRSNPLTDVSVLQVQPFALDQVHQFVRNWYLANEIMVSQRNDPGVRMAAREGAADLMLRLRQIPALLDMAVNPLLLTMIATVHRYRGSLPDRRVELYAEICDVFLGRRQQAKGLDVGLTPAQKRRVLQPLAYHMMRHNQRAISWAEAVETVKMPLVQVSPGSVPETFLEEVVNGSGLLLEPELKVYSFAHMTFQEYLAAVHALEANREPYLLKHIEDSWWHETIRLYAAQADATNIVRTCLALKKPSVKALTLAMECLAEAREVQPRVRMVFERLTQSVEHENPDLRQIAAEVQLALRLRRMLRVDENKYVDDSCVTHAEYQLFLNDERENGRYRQPDHWTGYEFAPGQGETAVVGVRPEDAVAFCGWLTQRESGEWHYRLIQPEEAKLKTAEHPMSDKPHEPESSLTPGYWLASDNGYQCSKVDIPRGLQLEFKEILEDRFASDWALHNISEQPHKVERAQAVILGRARQRHFTLLDLSRQFEHDPDVLAACNRLRDRATLAYAQHLDEAISQVLNRIQSLRLERARDIHLDEVMIFGRAFVRQIEAVEQLATPRDLELAHELGRDLGHTLSRAHDLAQNQELVLYQELTRALAAALKQTHDLVVILERAAMRARTRVRTQPLLHIVELLSHLEGERAENYAKTRIQNLHRLLNEYVDLYIDYALLEERRSQRLPALEGIRIARELAV